MSTASKPTLSLSTPVTASFPAEALKSAAISSATTPRSASWRDALGPAGLPSAGLPSAGLPSAGLLSAGLPSAGIISPIAPAGAAKPEEGLAKTPITPPLAYMDFLKMATPAFPSPGMTSPPLTGRASLKRASTAESTDSIKSHRSSTSSSSGSEDAGSISKEREPAEKLADKEEVESGPSTATSVDTDCSCDCDHVHKSPKVSTAVPVPPSPFPNHPMSAPATGPTSFPSLKVPPSPAVSNVDSPVRSPFSARSVRSPFDWEAALKARRYADAKAAAAGSSSSGQHTCSKTTTSSSSSSKTSVRHIREVITRTVTYTPRMNPAPKGKRRKVE